LNNIFRQIFRKGSRTHFYSSIFFPPKIKEDVSKLYSFVRVADDLVDSKPQKKAEFYAFKEKYRRAKEGETTGDLVIDSFIDLVEKKQLEFSWSDAFLNSMELDIQTRTYPNIEKLKKYLYGSAEVIGLMVAKILELPVEAYKHAMAHGRSLQYINFLRDLPEDLALGRIYFPQDELKENSLDTLEYNHVLSNLSGFKNFLHTQLKRYTSWVQEAEKGFHYIPKRYLIPIKTASEMYKWTARIIWNNPLIVYVRKVKPSILRIISQIGYNKLVL